MGWGEPHQRRSSGETGTTGQIAKANEMLDQLGVEPGPLALRVASLVERNRVDSMLDDPEVQGRLNAEWASILDAYSSLSPYAQRPGIRWVIVQAFGNRERLYNDAYFHAQVSYATQMLDVLFNLAIRSRDN